MKIRLLDWEDIEYFIDIPDDTEEITGVILSGDMVLESPIHYDTRDDRLHDYYDGYFRIRKENFQKLESISSSYDVFKLSE